VDNDLVAWLNRELDRRGWSQRELARRAELSHTTVSQVLAYQRQPSWDFCAYVASALEVDVDEVFALAGLRPAPPRRVPEEEEAARLLRHFPARVREVVMTMLQALAREAGRPAGVYEEKPGYDIDDPLVAAVIAELRQVPEEWRPEALREIQRIREMSERFEPRVIGEEEGEEAA
jgi:transcriptional regulator with XRE-family HTH domain